MASILIFYAWLVVNITKMRLFRFIHLIKIDNRTCKPTDFQQLFQRSVGLMFPEWSHIAIVGDIRKMRNVVFWLTKKKTPNFTFLGVKLGVNLVNHWYSRDIAEREGFEPPVPLSTTVFKSVVIDHSTLSPYFCMTFVSWSKSVCKSSNFF